VDRTWPKGVHVEEGCVVEAESVLLTHDMTRGLYLDTRVGARTVIGPRAIVMPGVTIGQDCRIAPGALVLRDVPPQSYVTGNPAQVAPLSS
jgi:acetyltransferase-like isoleucine patch superfamily enzyme